MYEKTIDVIPKDVLLCDSCNNCLTDEKRTAVENCFWVSWGLVCEPCYEKYFQKAVVDGNEELIQTIPKDTDLTNSKLFHPLVITSW